MKHFSGLIIKHTVSVLSEWNISFDFEIGFNFFFFQKICQGGTKIP